MCMCVWQSQGGEGEDCGVLLDYVPSAAHDGAVQSVPVGLGCRAVGGGGRAVGGGGGAGNGRGSSKWPTRGSSQTNPNPTQPIIPIPVFVSRQERR